MRAGQPADGRLERATASLAAVDDPFEHAHVFTETGPEEFSVSAFAKPIHIKDQRRVAESFTNVEPVLEIIPDVVSAEGQHRHWIAPHSPYGPRSGCGGFRRPPRAQIYAVTPIERLVNQRHRIAAAATE